MITIKRSFVINSNPNYCSVVLVNRGVTVSEDGSSAEVEVQVYGPATQLLCILDGEEAFSCKSIFCNHIHTFCVLWLYCVYNLPHPVAICFSYAPLIIMSFVIM